MGWTIDMAPRPDSWPPKGPEATDKKPCSACVAGHGALGGMACPFCNDARFVPDTARMTAAHFTSLSAKHAWLNLLPAAGKSAVEGLRIEKDYSEVRGPLVYIWL